MTMYFRLGFAVRYWVTMSRIAFATRFLAYAQPVFASAWVLSAATRGLAWLTFTTAPPTAPANVVSFCCIAVSCPSSVMRP